MFYAGVLRKLDHFQLDLVQVLSSKPIKIRAQQSNACGFIWVRAQETNEVQEVQGHSAPDGPRFFNSISDHREKIIKKWQEFKACLIFFFLNKINIQCTKLHFYSKKKLSLFVAFRKGYSSFLKKEEVIESSITPFFR